MSKQAHPLERDNVLPLRYWKEWREVWDANKSIEVRTSLLHCGFQMWNADGDRIKFYLSIAETNRFTLSETADERIYKARRKLALKALEVLCQDVFKQKNPTHDATGWIERIQNPEALEATLDFFRLEDSDIAPRFANRFFELSDHHRTTMNQFLIELAQLGWGRPAFEDRISQASWDLFHSKRREFVDILFGLKQLWRLTSEDFLGRDEEFDAVTLQRLEELALGIRLHFPFSGIGDNGFRKPDSVEQAAAFESQAGKILILARLRNAEVARLRELHRLELEKRRLDQRRRELAPGR